MTEEKNKSYFYEIDVTYAVILPIGENGAPIEVEKTEKVKVRNMSRTNRHHSKLAMMLAKGGDMERISEISEKFVDYAVEAVSPQEKKVKDDIKKDLIACMNIFNNEKVQEDIESFLYKLDFVRAAMTTEEAG